MKKKILFNVSNIVNWMGGVYYAQNIINLIFHSDKLCDEYEIHVLASSSNSNVFKKYGNRIYLTEINYSSIYANSIYFIRYMQKNKIDCWYALCWDFIDFLLVKKAIFWIADFQYIHLPQLFSKYEYNMRDYVSRYIAHQHNDLVFSSNDAYRDFKTCYSNYKCKCHVVHFTSDIINELQAMETSVEKQTLQKYELEKARYIYIPNQFWQHKNHLIVLQMIEKLETEEIKDILFVFTGQMHDYRNREYTEKLQTYFSHDIIKKRTRNLGFINRQEQLIIMKNAIFLIQPSLFEGWGTGLEDAKVLDKRVILSDLPVHEEQKYEKCVLFQRNNADDLLDKVKTFIRYQSEDNINRGIERFHHDSLRYAEELEKVLL